MASTIAAWAGRYLDLESESTAGVPELADGEVLVTELNQQFLRGMHTHDHSLRADEPAKYGGSNLGPTPYDLLLMSLGALYVDDTAYVCQSQKAAARGCQYLAGA